MKHLILDCGGVIAYPRLGDWNLPFGAAQILGEERARDLATAKYLMAHRECARWLDESQLVKDMEAEKDLRREYIRAMNIRMDWHLTMDEIERLAGDFTDNILRFGFFDDVKPWLERWYGHVTLGLLSDAMPSTLAFMEWQGLLPYFKAAVISTQVGAIKPDPRMYEAILKKLDADPADCLFVDDKAENLDGAVKAGMQAAQMTRSTALPATLWDGPSVKDFAAIDALLKG